MAGYFGESGTPVTWKNPQFVPENQRQNGGWYYNPATNRVDRWWNNGSGPQAQQQNNQPKQESYEDVVRRLAQERANKYNEQVNLWNQFMKDPNYFNQDLASKMAKQRFGDYYNTVLKEFVDPLEMKIRQGKEALAQTVQEVQRQRDTGVKQQSQQLEQNLETGKQGFATAGLYGSGGAARALARQRISGNESIADFIARSKAQEQATTTQQAQEEEALKGQESQKQTELFGTGRTVDQEVAKDVQQQQLDAQKRQAQKALEAITSRFGETLINIPDFLQFS